MIAQTHQTFKIEKSNERSRLRCWDLPDGERILLSLPKTPSIQETTGGRAVSLTEGVLHASVESTGAR